MKKPISLLQVNLLLLITICLQLGNALFMWMPQFVRMILNEALFIFLPAFILLKLNRQPVGKMVQWRWPGWKIALLSLVIGAGLYPLSAISAQLYQSLLGYQQFILPGDAIPTTVLTGILGIIAYAVMAPLCEEFLFRGVVQRTYEAHGFRHAYWLVGFLFMMFHLSLLQGLAIIPLCIALGFVYYRTRSLPASILTHFGANGLASIMLTSGVFLKSAPSIFLSQPALYLGLAVAIAALVLLWLATRKELTSSEDAPEVTEPALTPVMVNATASAHSEPVDPAIPQPGALPSRTPNRLTFSQSWPLLFLVLIFLFSAGVELFISRSPELISEPVSLDPQVVAGSHAWQYEIYNIDNQPVGQAQCTQAAEGDEMQFTCTSEHRAYEIHKGSSLFIGSDFEQLRSLRWRLNDLTLVRGEKVFNNTDGSVYQEIWTSDQDTFQVDYKPSATKRFKARIPVPGASLLGVKDVVMPEDVWPWMLSAMQPAEGKNGRLIIFTPYKWRGESSENGPEVNTLFVNVAGKEIVDTPAGKVESWKVTVGREEIAWFSVDDYRVVKYFDGAETWVMK